MVQYSRKENPCTTQDAYLYNISPRWGRKSEPWRVLRGKSRSQNTTHPFASATASEYYKVAQHNAGLFQRIGSLTEFVK